MCVCVYVCAKTKNAPKNYDYTKVVVSHENGTGEAQKQIYRCARACIKKMRITNENTTIATTTDNINNTKEMQNKRQDWFESIILHVECFAPKQNFPSFILDDIY